MLTNMLENKKLFIFDLDGTLIESLGVWSEADRVFIKNITGVEIDVKEIGRIRDRFLSETKDKSPYDAWVRYVKTTYNMDEQLEDLIEYRKAICFKVIGEMLRLKPNACELLTLLKEHGYKLCLATSGAPESLHRILYEIDATNFLGNDLFDLIIDSSLVSRLKPDPDIHLKALDYFKIKNDEVVVIEDSYVGLMAAKNAELDSIIVKEELADRQDEIKRDALYYVESLEEIYKIMLKIVKNRPKLR